MIKIRGRRIPMKELAPEQRVKYFSSVPLGYTAQEAVEEARRCVQCRGVPCEVNFPIHLRVLDMIRAIAARSFKEAFFILKEDNPLPAITGRVCPQESQCEGVCPLAQDGEGINIGKLEAFVADWARERGINEEINIQESQQRVAIIGSGPAGLICAYDLRRKGYQVVVFEALHKAGGVLQYGIPAFRLPTEVVDYEISFLEKIGVEFRLNFFVGQNIGFNELRRDYDAIFIGTGAGAPLFLGIEGENLKGVYSANEFLIRVNLMKAYRFLEYDTPIVCGDRVGVIGAGNVAMDAARCARRLGASQVFILYRRTRKESPARAEEIQHALEEGIIWRELVAPKRILGDEKGWCRGIELVRMKLGEPDASGRLKPVPIKGSEFVMELDTVIEALGTTPNRLFLKHAPELAVNRWGLIQVDEHLQTNLKGIFAGGDAIRGNSTVIMALGDGRKAADSIHQFLS